VIKKILFPINGGELHWLNNYQLLSFALITNMAIVQKELYLTNITFGLESLLVAIKH
jgi:hypothetical protein